MQTKDSAIKPRDQLFTPTRNPLNPTTNEPRQPTHAIDRVLNTRPISIHLNNSPANQTLPKEVPA
jgi:hypothetical protein